jgi:hypothetical protein
MYLADTDQGREVQKNPEVVRNRDRLYNTVGTLRNHLSLCKAP